MSEGQAPAINSDEALTALIQNYEVSSKLQHEVLQNIRQLADEALPKAGEAGQLTPGESLIFWALSQQLDVVHAQLTQLEQVNLAILKRLLEGPNE